MTRFVGGLAVVAAMMLGCSQGADTTAPPTTASTSTTNTPESTATTAAAPTTDSGATVEMGAQLAARSTCTGCHTLDGSPNNLAPTLLGASGSTVTLNDGTTVVADAGYLRRSIVDPAAEIVEGDWAAVMPSTYTFTGEELDALVLYLESLAP